MRFQVGLFLILIAAAGQAQTPTEDADLCPPGGLKAPEVYDLPDAPDLTHSKWRNSKWEDRTAPRLKNFHRDLLKNYRGLVAWENAAPLIVGGLAVAGTHSLDQPVVNALRDREKSAFSDGGNAMGNGFVVSSAVGSMFLVSRFWKDTRFQNFTYSAAQGFVINQTVTRGIKLAVVRDRPNLRNQNSFPSGHTSNTFTWATIASHYYGKRVGIPAYLTGAYVAWSRLDDKQHHVSDVVAGAALGLIVGRTVVRNTERKKNRRVIWNAGMLPGGGIGGSVQIRLGRKR